MSDDIEALSAELILVRDNERRWKKRAEDYKAEIEFLTECRNNQERTIKELQLKLDGGLPR